MAYDPVLVLKAVDANAPVVLAFAVVAALATFTYLTECWRLAVRHQAYPVPLGAVGWFALHDLGFALQYNKWFVEYDHWWCKLWWGALIGTAFMEFVLIGMVIHYGHKELLPRISKAAFGVLVVAATAAMGVIWALVKSSLNDDLYLISFPITALWALPLGTALLFRRRSQRGQSAVLPICVIVIMLAFQGAFWTLDPLFRSPTYMALTATAVLWGLFEVWLFRQFPAHEPGRGWDSASAHTVHTKSRLPA